MSLQTINVQKSLIWKKVLFSGNKMKNRLQFDKQCCAAMQWAQPYAIARALLSLLKCPLLPHFSFKHFSSFHKKNGKKCLLLLQCYLQLTNSSDKLFFVKKTWATDGRFFSKNTGIRQVKLKFLCFCRLFVI